LLIIGEICSKVSAISPSHSAHGLELQVLTRLQAKRTAEEEGDYMAFEQLVAEAAIKKEKESKKKGKDKKEKHSEDKQASAAATAADAPNVPKASSS
jgi:hypothetical protein